MHVIRGIYDGKTIRPLPTEALPRVDRDVPVEIVFLDQEAQESEERQRMEAAERLIASSQTTPLRGVPLYELINDGRYR